MKQSLSLTKLLLAIADAQLLPIVLTPLGSDLLSVFVSEIVRGAEAASGRTEDPVATLPDVVVDAGETAFVRSNHKDP